MTKKNRSPRRGKAPSVPSSSGGPKRTVVTAIRWAAWITLLCTLLSQAGGKPPEEAVQLGLFLIAGLLYAISMVLERKYRW